MKKLIAIAVAGLLAVSAQAAPEVIRLDSLAAAAYGASYVTIVDHSDLSDAFATNHTYELEYSIPAKVGLTLAGVLLDEPFNDAVALGAANAVTNSIALTVGDGTTGNYFLKSTQVAEDSTPVYVQFAPLGAALALQTATISGTSVVTNVVTSLQGQKYYPTTGKVTYLFTADAATVVTNLTKGRVKIFWRELR